MNSNISFRTRREFLRTTLLGGAFSWSVPSFLASTFDALQAGASDSATQVITGKDAPILVVIQMAGGNDGLNTVVPFTNDHYFRARPRLGTVAKSILKLNDALGLHSGMEGFKSLYDAEATDFVRVEKFVQPKKNSETHALHVKKVLDYVDVLGISSKRFKVVLDSVNGAGCVATSMMLSRLGCQVVHMNNTPDGRSVIVASAFHHGGWMGVLTVSLISMLAPPSACRTFTPSSQARRLRAMNSVALA